VAWEEWITNENTEYEELNQLILKQKPRERGVFDDMAG